MTPIERERWSRVRKRGWARFLVLRGSLGWGVPAGLVWLFALCAFRDQLSWAFIGSSVFVLRLLIALTVFPTVGLLWAVKRWSVMERRFRAVQPEPVPDGSWEEDGQEEEEQGEDQQGEEEPPGK